MRHILIPVLLSVTALVETLSAAEAPKPNIVVLFADDFGLDGVSCYGSDHHKTPNIDKLAATGTLFETCYASPLCGPTRCLLMTGRYAFRTGGITNQSWRKDGPGAKSADEYPMARILKEAGYTTGMCGKWRQVGETPNDWGFDEYITDPTAGGWFWQTKHEKNRKEFTAPEGSYAPDVIHDFAIDFLKRHKDERFFFYYSFHHVHGPILKTPDSTKGESKDQLYTDNIAYLDKQVGAVTAELEKLGLREKTLILFTCDNGTALTFPNTIGGRMLNGKKASMLEGGSRVPFIASWPGTTPAGKVSKDILSFADPHATFAELAGAKLPDSMKFDGQSFAPQLLGQQGKPREWAFVQLGKRWYVREAGFKMNEQGELFDMSDAPFVEKPIAKEADTPESKSARDRLTKVLSELNPAAGKQDAGGGGNAAKKAKRKAKKNAT